MDFLLNPQQKQFQEAFSNFCQARIAPRSREADRTGIFPHQNWEDLKQQEYFALFHDREQGGKGADGITLAIAIETLAKACASTAWIATISTLLSGKIITNFGTPAHQKKWLLPIIKGEKIACFSIVELRGSDRLDLRTHLVKTKDGYLLNGSKNKTTNIPGADVGIIYTNIADEQGNLKNEFAYAIVELTNQNIKQERIETQGLRAMPWGRLTFENVWVPESDVIILKNANLEELLKTVEWGQFLIACCSLGIAEAAVLSAINYTKKSQIAGVPLIELQSVHRQLVDMKIEIKAARAMIWYVAGLKEKKQSARELVAIAKINATEMAVRIAQTAMNLHGGWGFSTEYDVERLLRDSQGSLAGGLAADVLRESITCSLFGINQWQPESCNTDLIYGNIYVK